MQPPNEVKSGWRAYVKRLSVLAFILLALSNLAGLVLLKTGATYESWTCSHCGARLLAWPALDKSFAFLDGEYCSPNHSWVRDWSTWVPPWKWLSTLLTHSDPQSLFIASNCPAYQSKAEGLLSAYVLEPEPLSGKARTALEYDLKERGTDLLCLVREVLPRLSGIDEELQPQALRRLGALWSRQFANFSEVQMYAAATCASSSAVP